jgi:glyoxylase-like metal-dependent hydrolase (beta-lactamase superfamily II)
LTLRSRRGLLSATRTSRDEAMGEVYEIYAIRYATMAARTPHMNYLHPDPHETAAADLDYFVWLIRGGGRDILVDTGFNEAAAQGRGRALTTHPVEAQADFGVDSDTMGDVVVTHLPYDHAGNLDRFPQARFHLQGPRDEICHRAVHVQRAVAAPFLSRGHHAYGAPRLQRPRNLPQRPRRGGRRHHPTPRRRTFRRPANRAG